MDIVILKLIRSLHLLPVELVSLFLFVICISSILLLFKIFGKQGLFIYNIVAVLSANIQVLRGAKLLLSQKPIALGTIVFASTYLCTGILTEHYGHKAAKDNVWLCFSAQILMMIIMLVTIGHKPLHKNHLVTGTEHMLLAQEAISILFIPSSRLLISSLLSFIIAQFVGIWSFSFIAKISNNKFLWLRTLILLAISTTLDTIIFNLLAWKILTNNPANFLTIFSTYILWALIMQFLVTFLSTPVIYISYFFKKFNNEQPAF